MTAERAPDCTCLYCRLARELDAEIAADPGCGLRLVDALTQLLADVIAANRHATQRDQLHRLVKSPLLDEHLQQALARQVMRRWH